MKFLGEDAEILKSILRGDYVKVNVKNQHSQQVRRTPVILCCNEDPWLDMLQIDQTDVKARIFHSVIFEPHAGAKFFEGARNPNVSVWPVFLDYLKKSGMWEMNMQYTVSDLTSCFDDVFHALDADMKKSLYTRFETQEEAKQQLDFLMRKMLGMGDSDDEEEDNDDVETQPPTPPFQGQPYRRLSPYNPPTLPICDAEDSPVDEQGVSALQAVRAIEDLMQIPITEWQEWED